MEEQHPSNPSADPASTSQIAPAAPPGAQPSLRHRLHLPGYERLLDQVDDEKDDQDYDLGASTSHRREKNLGLGIADRDRTASFTEAKGAATASTSSTPKHAFFPTSPNETTGFTEHTGYEGAGATVVDTDDGFRRHGSRRMLPSVSSMSSVHSPYVAGSDTDTLRRTPASLYGAPNPYGFSPIHACPTRKNFYRGRNSWFTWTIIVLSLYSTTFSLIYLVIAIRSPRWPFIHDHGSLTPANASLVTAIFAKTIELSFATAFVAFLGQVLSRRSMAVACGGKGVTLAELSMRNWVFQPGVMITRWETVRYAGLSILGVISFAAAMSAMLYTSAADALVQPQLKYGDWDHKEIAGNVSTTFANGTYLEDHCQTPVTTSMDPQYRGSTCLDLYYNAKSSHDFQTYLSNWAMVAEDTSGGVTIQTRAIANSLAGTDMIVNGTWTNVTIEEQDGRIINRASLAMPHSGVLQAARDPRNKILQPDQLGGLGAYTLIASTPNPVVDVVCANMNRSELAPIVWTAWHSVDLLNTTDFTSQLGWYGPDNWLNKTVVDDIFGWGQDVENGEHPPVFAKYPKAYNTILNQTAQSVARPSVYILGRDGDTTTERYSLCQMKAHLTANCSTTYNAAAEGSSLFSVCDPDNNKMAYINHIKNATGDALMAPSNDWFWIASEVANSMSLNTGIADGAAANCRMLTESILREPKLNPKMPTMAESMAVIMGGSLLMATEDTPFVGFWNHTATLSTPETQYINATIRSREYASGPNGSPQKAFYAVLAAVALFNALCLVYFIRHRGLVTDFSEPSNLFALAVNSPPTAHLAGSCGVGPQGPQYKIEWYINEDNEHLYMHTREAMGECAGGGSSSAVDPETPSSATFSKTPTPAPSSLAGWKKHVLGGGFARGGGKSAAEIELRGPEAFGARRSESKVSSTFERFSRSPSFF